MQAPTIQDASRRSGLSEPTLRYYETVGLMTLRAHLDYLRLKAALWDARERGDGDAEVVANLRVRDVIPRLQEAMAR
jgi:hypothetical protein